MSEQETRDIIELATTITLMTPVERAMTEGFVHGIKAKSSVAAEAATA